MIIDDTAGFQFLMSEDIYLLRKELGHLEMSEVEKPAAVTAATEDVAEVHPVVAFAENNTEIEVPAIIVAEPVSIVQTPIPHFDYSGGNQQRFLIVCNYAGSMDEKHLAALTSTLLRKGLSLDDVAIVNMAYHTSATTNEIVSYFKASRLLILGIDARLAGWEKFQLNQLENADGVKVLYTHSFGEMMGDRDKTKAFWEQMKVL
jgi:hypothetical protein